MTLLDKIHAACKNADYSDIRDLDTLIAVVYSIGREEATREISDKYNDLIAEQNRRADQCRYSKMAHKIVGDMQYIYSPDYRGDSLECWGSDEWLEEAKNEDK